MRVGPRTWDGATFSCPIRQHTRTSGAISRLISVVRCASWKLAVCAAIACRRALGTAAMRKVVRGLGRLRRCVRHAAHARYRRATERTSGACFSPLARGRHVRRGVIGVRRNMMRVGSHMGRGCDCDARCGFMVP